MLRLADRGYRLGRHQSTQDSPKTFEAVGALLAVTAQMAERVSAKHSAARLTFTACD
jgi:hypothetical protein